MWFDLIPGFSLDVIWRDGIKNDDIRGKADARGLRDMAGEAKLRWYENCPEEMVNILVEGRRVLTKVQRD